jgi:TonB family protein
MSQEYRPFASYLRFKEILADPMGHLYRAGEFDTGGLIRPVWLRVFDGPGVPANEIALALDRARLIAEAVQSTSVAGGFDGVVADGVPAIAHDYSASKPLSVVLERAAEERFPVPVDNALLILEKISLALTATSTLEVDGERVVHGLLHPGLILVTHDGESQVMGFGVAPELLPLVDEAAAAESLHPYLAPEVIASRTSGRRGDVYSLGAILFHLLTGHALPQQAAERSAALEAAQLNDGEVPLPDDIRGLLQRSLADQPEHRFSSAADFKKELDRLLYGGTYSPTTFNLALFMDRLFRAEIEAEERELAAEQKVDVSVYLDTALETQPMTEDFLDTPPPATPRRRGLWIGLAAAAVIAAAAIIGTLVVGRGPSTASVPPTPTAEEIEAQRQAQDAKMRELAEGLVAEMMAEKEQEIRQELSARQAKIDELQRKLDQSERRARQGELSRDEVRRREELQRQIAAEEEAQRQQEADLAAEKERAVEEARAQVVAGQPSDGPVAAGDAVAVGTASSGPDAALGADDPGVAVTDADAEPTVMPTIQPTTIPSVVPTAAPTGVPTPPATATPELAEVVQTNAFVDPSEADTLPLVIKEEPVTWPAAAAMSGRRGVVIIRATVNADGLVEEVSVLRTDHDDLGIPQAASEAAMKYRFKPGTKDGVRIKTYATITKPYRFMER